MYPMPLDGKGDADGMLVPLVVAIDPFFLKSPPPHLVQLSGGLSKP